MRKEGMGLNRVGVVTIIHGHVFMDDALIEDVIRDNFDGRYAELELHRPEDQDQYPIDDKIRPLVKALIGIGLTTLSSCQGHMHDVRGERIRYPYVSVYGDDQSFKSTLLDLTLPSSSNWELKQYNKFVYRLRPRKEADTEKELAIMQQQAIRIAHEIGKLRI